PTEPARPPAPSTTTATAADHHLAIPSPAHPGGTGPGAPHGAAASRRRATRPHTQPTGEHVPSKPVRLSVAIASTALLLGAVACRPEDTGTAAPTPNTAATTGATAPPGTATYGTTGHGRAGAGPVTGGPTASPADTALDVLVTSDDGVGSAGMEAIAEGIGRVLGDGSTVQIVAPAANQSRTGGRTSDGPVNYTKSDASNGPPVTEVNGFPADAVNVALDDLGM